MKENVFLVASIFKIPFRFELSQSFDSSNEFILFKDIKIQSHIDYLSEYGMIISKDSKNVSETFNVAIYAKSLKRKVNSLFDYSCAMNNYDKLKNNNYNSFLIPDSFSYDLENCNNSIKYFSMNFKPHKTDMATSFSELGAQNNFRPSFLFLKSNDMMPKNKENIMSFSVSNYSFFLLKHFIPNEKSAQVIFYYTEIDKTPIWIQVFVHLPVLMLFITIFIMIAWFETGSSDSVIEDEISKIPVRKYDTSLNFCECSICLDSFYEDQDIKILNCKHCFHQNCIDSWLRNMLRCPICRNPVSKIANSSSYQLYQALNSI